MEARAAGGKPMAVSDRAGARDDFRDESSPSLGRFTRHWIVPNLAVGSHARKKVQAVRGEMRDQRVRRRETTTMRQAGDDTKMSDDTKIGDEEEWRFWKLKRIGNEEVGLG
ncbi:hypothetical protein PIB30_099640 [Stylosanthes scabra]|uniref:Uncharacterized protein n=1 Tax=Stylosanthes scabra TaxID=79078 RepID=A0ABU6VWU6_9FABA|nr:hypothetical protein [Stylosanthes scabra]